MFCQVIVYPLGFCFRFYEVVVKELAGNHTPVRQPFNYSTEELLMNKEGLRIVGRVNRTDAQWENHFVVGQEVLKDSYRGNVHCSNLSVSYFSRVFKFHLQSSWGW